MSLSSVSPNISVFRTGFRRHRRYPEVVYLSTTSKVRKWMVNIAQWSERPLDSPSYTIIEVSYNEDSL